MLVVEAYPDNTTLQIEFQKIGQGLDRICDASLSCAGNAGLDAFYCSGELILTSKSAEKQGINPFQVPNYLVLSASRSQEGKILSEIVKHFNVPVKVISRDAPDSVYQHLGYSPERKA